MAYTVDFTNGTKTPITVTNNSVDTSTSIGLVGQGYKIYGEVIAEDLLHLLENFASGSAPTKPIEGQLWYDSNTNQLKYFDDTVANAGNWKAVASMTVQSDAPTAVGERDGHFWLDSDTGELYLYYNGQWISLGNAGGATRVVARQRYGNPDANNDGIADSAAETLYDTIEVIVNGQIVSVTSSSSTGWIPVAAGANTEYLEDGITPMRDHFSTIRQGINLNGSENYVFAGTALEALYADLAERYHADDHYQYGTVVQIGGEKEVTQTVSAYSPDVFGVVSTNPGLKMNAGAGNDMTHPYIALSGRIPVRVVGKVSKGERLVSSSIPGHAMSAGSEAGINWQYVIGRALEDKINDEPGIVEVVVGAK